MVSKLKKRLSIFVILVLIIITVITFLGAYLKYTIYTPISTKDEKVAFEIQKGSETYDIAQKLEDRGLIRNKYVFMGFLKFRGNISEIKAGKYNLNKNYTMLDIIAVLTKGDVVVDKITIPEGWTIAQIEEELAKKGITNQDDFEEALNKNYTQEFLKGKSSLQGFLFPDTYFLSSNPDGEEVIERMLLGFEEKADPKIREEIGDHYLNYYEILKLASIVEEEVSNQEDRRLVAGVFLNRLKLGMKLDSDATLSYIFKTNKRSHTIKETKIDNPFNTYRYKGLPPTPISNPGLDAIEATLNPEISEYLYFLSGKDGKTYFSETLEEHERKKRLFL